MRGPQFSVIVPAYQAQATITCCLQALFRQTVPQAAYEVIVVDDESTDNTRERVRSFPRVRLLSQKHAGPAAARNLGLQNAKGQVVLFTDADCEPAPDWIEQMVAPLGDPAVAGAKGVYHSQQRELVARFVQIEYEDKYTRMRGQDVIDFVDTYSACYRRRLLLAAGGFDTTFPEASVEDQELSFRLAMKGHRLVFAPRAHVNHWGHARSVGAYARRKFRIGYWKALVLRRYPQKALHDSHTPQVMKVQMLLAAVGGLFLVGSALWQPLIWGCILSALLFVLSTVPFVLRACRKDPLAAAVAPPLLLLRAISLGVGLVAGFSRLALLRPAREQRRDG